MVANKHADHLMRVLFAVRMRQCLSGGHPRGARSRCRSSTVRQEHHSTARPTATCSGEFGHQVYPPGNRAEKQIEHIVPQRSPGLQAIVHLQADEESGVEGDLIFTQIVPNGPVTIEGNITGLAPGLHGIHVHQTGAVKDNCKEIGPHFIAFYGRHGGPHDNVRHIGDLGNIKAEDGPLTVRLIDHLISLAGPRSIIGRSLAISKGEDDYGRASTEDSGLTGTSGPAIACGIIGYLR